MKILLTFVVAIFVFSSNPAFSNEAETWKKLKEGNGSEETWKKLKEDSPSKNLENIQRGPTKEGIKKAPMKMKKSRILFV